MKRILFVLAIILTTLNLSAQENEVTTYYFIRHAEKVRIDKTDKNPLLSEKGQLRAENWKKVFKNVNFDFIYSTNYNRSIQTASPTLKNKNLEIEFYNPRDLYNEDFKQKTKGKTVLVVGHSNTTPSFVNKIMGKEKYSDIDDSNNSNLYIITVSHSVRTSQLLYIPI